MWSIGNGWNGTASSISTAERRTTSSTTVEGYVKAIGTPDEINELAGILEGSVLYKAATEEFMSGDKYGYAIGQHCGMTIYIPVAKFRELNTQRNACCCSRKTSKKRSKKQR